MSKPLTLSIVACSVHRAHAILLNGRRISPFPCCGVFDQRLAEWPITAKTIQDELAAALRAIDAAARTGQLLPDVDDAALAYAKQAGLEPVTASMVRDAICRLTVLTPVDVGVTIPDIADTIPRDSKGRRRSEYLVDMITTQMFINGELVHAKRSKTDRLAYRPCR